MSRKNRLFAKLADTINENGRVETDALSADVSLGVSVDEYADTNAMPTSATLGDLALVTSTNSIYLYNGSAWFNIAMVNQAPTAIAGNQVGYELAADGTATVITLVSTDPEGLPLTWSSSVSGDTQVGTVTNTDNVFTVTPSTDEANAGILSVTFSVTDGNNTENSTSTFTLAFAPDFTTVTQQAKIQSSDIAAGDYFGDAVAIDGDTAIIGARAKNDTKGAAYIFTRSGSTWTQQAKLVGSGLASGDQFGYSVAIDGDTVAIGANGDDTRGSGAGAIYVFTRSGSTWTQQAKLTPTGLGESGSFAAVAISGDTLIGGARGDDGIAGNAGAAYIFTRSGSTWTQQAKLTASDAIVNHTFGISVAIDGDTVAIGAYGDASFRGAAYIFTRSGSTWTQQAKIIASDGASNDVYGMSIAIDGNNVIVGAPWHSSYTGAAYVYTRSGSTWTQQQKLVKSSPASMDEFGRRVNIQGDAAFVGALGAGALYIFTRSGSTWTQINEVQAADASAADEFAAGEVNGIGVSKDTIIAAAAKKDTNGSNAGAAYIFVAG